MRSRGAARQSGSSAVTEMSEVRMVRPADEVYRTLKSQIQTGQLAPGEHLVEDSSAAA
jgi:DNA-binding GntR family transcriptional regulator